MYWTPAKMLLLANVDEYYFTNAAIYIWADSRFAPSQWETLLQSNAVSHWLGTNLESALLYIYFTSIKIQWVMLPWWPSLGLPSWSVPCHVVKSLQLSWQSTGSLSSNKLQWLVQKIGYQDSGPCNGLQAHCLFYSWDPFRYWLFTHNSNWLECCFAVTAFLTI